jgi:hypothetical protein
MDPAESGFNLNDVDSISSTPGQPAPAAGASVTRTWAVRRELLCVGFGNLEFTPVTS